MLSRGSKCRLLAPLALVAVALTGAPVSATRQQALPPPGPPGDAQVVVATGNGRLAHTVRDFWGNWQRFDGLGPYGRIIGLTSTYHLGEENVFFHTDDDGGRLVHLVRHNDDTWETAGAPAERDRPTGLAVTDVAGALVLIGNGNRGPELSVQQADGAWSPWLAVPADGTVAAISATAADRVLRVVELDGDGRSVDVRDRAADGRWTNAVHSTTPYRASDVSAAQVDGELQVAAVAAGRIYHGRLTEDGSWTGFTELAGADDAVHVAVTAWLRDLQLVYTTGNGRIRHSLRLGNGSWQPWGDVTRESGATADGAVAIAARSSY